MKKTKGFTATEVEELIKEGKVKYLNIEEEKSVPDLYKLETPIVVGDLPDVDVEPQVIREVKFELDESKLIEI